MLLDEGLLSFGVYDCNNMSKKGCRLHEHVVYYSGLQKQIDTAAAAVSTCQVYRTLCNTLAKALLGCFAEQLCFEVCWELTPLATVCVAVADSHVACCLLQLNIGQLPQAHHLRLSQELALSNW